MRIFFCSLSGVVRDACCAGYLLLASFVLTFALRGLDADFLVVLLKGCKIFASFGEFSLFLKENTSRHFRSGETS